MVLVKQFWLGIKSFMLAFPFMFRHGLYPYVAVPAAVMIMLYKGGEMLVGRQSFSEADNMSDILWYIVRLLIDIFFGLTLMTFAKFIVVIVLSPLLTYLSERCETILTGNKYHFSLEQFWNDIKRAIKLAFRNIIRQYIIIIPIYILAWLLWKDPLKSPLMWLVFIVSAYFYGFSFIDYLNERRKLDFKKSIKFVRDNKGLAVSIGGCYALMIFGPVDLGIIFSFKNYDPSAVLMSILDIFYHLILWILASSAPVLGIIAATLAMRDLGHLKSEDVM